MKKLMIILFVFSLLSITAYSATPVPATPALSPHYYSDLWYQTSAERNALYREIYLFAAEVIAHKIQAEHLKPQQWGVIMDIDETILDNSQYTYQHDILGKPEKLFDYFNQGISVPLPGAKAFINQIHAWGGYVNLVSNRPLYLRQATERNLKEQGIYFDQLLLDETNRGTSFVDKNPNFDVIAAGTEAIAIAAAKIIAWFGDNIQDFPHLNQVQMDKEYPNGDSYNSFGITYFIFPNPEYGSWVHNKF